MSNMEVLDLVITRAEETVKSAVQIQAMLQAADENGVKCNEVVDELIQKFTPVNEHEIASIRINGDLANLKAEIYESGLRISYNELSEVLQRMGKNG